MIPLLIAVLTISYIVSFFINVLNDKDFVTEFLSNTIMLMVFTAIVVMFVLTNAKPIIIQKSSDSEWELSDNYSIKSDTCITRIVVLQGDTLYPTTCYKVLKK